MKILVDKTNKEILGTMNTIREDLIEILLDGLLNTSLATPYANKPFLAGLNSLDKIARVNYIKSGMADKRISDLFKIGTIFYMRDFNYSNSSYVESLLKKNKQEYLIITDKTKMEDVKSFFDMINSVQNSQARSFFFNAYTFIFMDLFCKS